MFMSLSTTTPSHILISLRLAISPSTETSICTRKYSARSGRTAKLYRSRTHCRSTPRVASRANAVYAYRSASTIIPALSGGMILYSNRSAKSVACSRLNVIGVRAFFFFPALVAAFTRADEFHSVRNTRCPSAVSHFASRASCVVLPDPSIPSTTKSLPGYSCGCVRLFSIGVCRFDTKRFAGHLLEGARVARGRPEFELGIAARPDVQQIVVAAIVELETDHDLRMTAVEALGEAENGAERAHRP